jgi:Na+/H+-dicarboxylate symporter
MAIGIVPGRFDPEPGAKVHPLGDAFIKAIRVLITR